MSPAGPTSPDRDAEIWHAHVAGALRSSMPYEAAPPLQASASLAEFISLILEDGLELVILVPGDDVLPEIAGALDLAIRPLCLVLPQAGFAAGIALRATISLLRSRLWRDGDESRSGIWLTQRERLVRLADPWSQAQDFLRRTDQADPPTALCALFPVLVMPLSNWSRQAPRPDAIFAFYGCDAPADLEIDPGRQLHIALADRTDGTRDLTVSAETTRLLLERTRLTQDIADLELELASVQGELGEFVAEYYRRVAGLMAEHDALQALRAARRATDAPDSVELRTAAAEKNRQAEESAAEARRFTEISSPESIPFNPKPEAKRLFRRLAQQIHPDRAGDAEDRAWRTQLMSEANRAYRNGDVRGLLEIAALWDEPASARRSSNANGAEHLELQLKRLRARLGQIESELHRLFGSQLYELFIAARQAGRQGRDLLGEMATQLGAGIAELRQQLESAAPLH